MRYSITGSLVTIVLLASVGLANEAKEEAIRKDRARIQGVWQVTSLTISGNRAKDADAQKIQVVNGNDGTWSIRSEGKEIVKGTSIIDPTSRPKTIDFTPTKGGAKDDLFLGIYQLGKKKRKLCFAPAGKDRPAKFSSTAENQQILVTFQRVKEKPRK